MISIAYKYYINHINIKYYQNRMLLIKDGDPDTHARIHFLIKFNIIKYDINSI